jgi:hypothetical protein
MLWTADVLRLYVEVEAASVEGSRKFDELRVKDEEKVFLSEE